MTFDVIVYAFVFVGLFSGGFFVCLGMFKWREEREHRVNVRRLFFGKPSDSVRGPALNLFALAILGVGAAILLYVVWFGTR